MIGVTMICVNNFVNIKSNQIFGYTDASSNYIHPTILPNILTSDQIKNIINYCSKNLSQSLVISGRNDSVRNSRQSWINKNDPLVKPIFEYLSKLYNIPFENAEDLQVIKYEPNQYYKEHHDSCCDNVDSCHNFVKNGGQRILTVLIYLNNTFEGGETYFKNLNIKMKAPPGSAIVFYPLAFNSKLCHPNALHAGLPVTKGEKWVANVWFREKKFEI